MGKAGPTQDRAARPTGIVVYWDTLQHGLALAVQPSGHLAWNCVYTIRQRGRPRRYHVGNGQGHIAGRRAQAGGQDPGSGGRGRRPARGSARAARQGSFEQVARRYVEEHAGRGTRVDDKWTRLSLSTCCHGGPSLDIGSIRRVDVKTAIAAIARRVLANQVLAAASPIFSGPCDRRSSLRTRAPA